jgi:capsular polysaccharide biosynthesis protein
MLGAIRVLLKWKKQILIVTVTATVIAAAYSVIFMDDYFKSYATLYPINLAYNDRAAIFNLEQIDYYGTKEDVNRVLTITQSGPIEAYIIEKYNLADHYKISKEKKYWRTKVQKEFESNYKSIKTEQGAIELSILDTDPKLGVEIINEIINKTDSIYRNSLMASKRQQLATFTRQLADRQKKIEEYGDTLAILGKQSNIVVKAGFDKTDIIEGNDLHAVQVYKAIYAKQKNALIELNENSNIKEQIENSLENDSKSLAVVDVPVIADKKEKPIRSVICITVFLLTFVFSIFGALLVDQIQDIRKQL